MPRKTRLASARPHADDPASMRPRPDAAENRLIVSIAFASFMPASMRPRPDAAENLRRVSETKCATLRFNEAAARCRGKPRRRAGERSVPVRASMRPRPDAAENLEYGYRTVQAFIELQ